MTTYYKGYEIELRGAKELIVKRNGVEILHDYHRTIEYISQIHELVEVLDDDG